MKNWLKVLVAMVLVLTFVFAFAACNKDSADDDSGDKQNSAQTPGDDSDKDNAGNNNGGNIDGGNTDDGNTDDGKNEDDEKPDLPIPPEDEEDPDLDDEVIDGFKINFYYSYTALVTNDNDRTQEVNQRKLVKSVTIPYDNNGWEDVYKNGQTYLDVKNSIMFNGYKFEKWYAEKDWDRKSKPQKPTGNPFTFTDQITEDINLYADKGVIAGDDITWKIQYDYQTDAAIPPETLLEGESLVNFVVAQKDKNIYSKIAIAALVVNGTDGWTTELVDAKNALKFDNFGIDAWYTAWDFEKNAPIGEAYAFDAAPTEAVTLYGQLAKENDGTSDQTQKTKIAATLYLDGKGVMYDFTNRTSVDVPWYDYRKDITSVILDDEITYIGQNAFCEMSSLKDVHFPEKLEVVGGYAFYEVQSKSFKTLRLPAGVKTVGSNAFAYTLLTQVILNDGLETLSGRAFYSSNKIKSIVIPLSLTTIEAGAFHPGANGAKNNTHALSKVYFKGTEEHLLREAGGVRIKLLDPETGEQKFVVNENGIKELLYVTIGLDNEWFNELATIYSYMPKTGEDVALDTLSWYANVVEGVMYPAQYSYALKYKEKSVSLKALFVDYVPIVAKVDENGDAVFDEDGNPIYEGRITAENIANQQKLMHEDGYGYLEFTSGGQVLAENDIIVDDRDIECVRVKEANNIREGILGGGITWKLDSSGTLTISPNADPDYAEDPNNPVKNKVNHMWDVSNLNASGMLWYNSMNKVVNVKKIIIEEGIEHIGTYAFAGTGITEISIPTSVTSIAHNAFDNCSSLHSIYYEGENFDIFNYYQKDENGELVLDEETNAPILIGNYANEIKTPSAKVYAKATAPTADLGSYWYAIGEQKVAWILDETGKLYVGGDSTMVNFAAPSDAPWFGAKDYIKSVVVAGNITSVAENLVLGYSNVASIKLHEKIKYVPESAFVGTALLNNIDAYPGGVLIIDKVLLKVDPTRRNTTIFATNADTFIIADGAFSRCDKIKTIYISGTIQYINANAFYDTSLEKLYVDNTKGVWSAVAADCDFSNATNPDTQVPVQMFYKGDFKITKTGYEEVSCNHVFGEAVVIEDSTCSTTGTEKKTCLYGDNCASKLLENQEIDGEMVAVWVPYYEISVIDKDLSKHNHVNPVYTEPTCLKDGYTTTTCDVEYVEIVDGVEVTKVCGHQNIVYDEGTQLTHATDWEEINKVEDSCVAAGYTEYKCKGFDTVGDVQIQCTATKREEGTKLDHTFVEYVDDDGDGIETATCTTCPEGTTPATDTREKQNVEE